MFYIWSSVQYIVSSVTNITTASVAPQVSRDTAVARTGGKLSKLTSAEETKAQSNLTGLEKVSGGGGVGIVT